MELVLSAVLAAVAALTTSDPAPCGPRRPYEPDVAGPINIETGTATVTKDGGSRHTESGEKPAAPRRFVFLFDTSIRFNTEAFPVCDRAVIEQRGVAACPERSKVGSGRAEFYPTGAADVAVFNTRYANGMRGVLITIPATGTIVENTFERVSRPYRQDYTWGSDEIIPPDAVPPQDRAVTSRFQVSFGATRNGRSFAESDAPAGRQLHIGLWSEYVTGQVITNHGTVMRP